MQPMIKLMHDAEEMAGTTPGMRAETPDEQMAEVAKLPEGGRKHMQSIEPGASHQQPPGQIIAEPQQSQPQQTVQPQSAPAVRTLDDIMSQFEGLPQQPMQSSSSPTARQKPHTSASGIPRQAQMHQEGAGGHDGQVHAAHAGQDQEMPDAMEAGMPPQTAAETPNGTLLQGKVAYLACCLCCKPYHVHIVLLLCA